MNAGGHFDEKIRVKSGKSPTPCSLVGGGEGKRKSSLGTAGGGNIADGWLEVHLKIGGKVE